MNESREDLASEDNLSEATKLVSNLGTRIRYQVYYLEKCGSTQDVARELAEKGAQEGVVVVAEEQENGRGRLGRRWFSGRGGLWFTVVLKPQPDALGLLSLGVGVAVGRLLRGLGISAGLKWPNDVLVDGRKAGGILVEGFTVPGDGIVALVGVGLNVNNELPPGLAEISVALREVVGARLPRLQLFMNLLREIDNVYLQLLEGRGEVILEEWRRLSVTLGKTVKIITSDGEYIGVAVDVGSLGELYIDTGDGVRAFYAGDVVHVR